MTRGTMRAILRRQLQEATPDNWEDAELNDMLNAGLAQAVIPILKADPFALIEIVDQQINVNQEFYSKPDGIQFEYMLMLLGTDGRYREITRRDYWQGRQRGFPAAPGSQPSGLVEFTYSTLGRFWAIHPVPTVTIPLGLRTIYAPTPSMAIDTDVPKINEALHMLPVAWAKRFILGETGEGVAETIQLINSLEERVPMFYRKSGGEADTIQPDLVKDYGLLDNR